eukprot:TRINITY_DN14620_c3_g1_i4.p1 TRINITY_DN14620_c3_g1~~TRINITY_DN14620_c3_g1_i4.p1  ORF type:complete len:308 (+),score=75.04 TRINITY_DN14620_c3_g1_i4:56-979(+)
MLTVYVAWGTDRTGAPVDVGGSDTVGALKEKVGGALGVRPRDFTLYHEGEELGDVGLAVSETELAEGDRIEARPSRNYEATEELKGMGLGRCESGLNLFHWMAVRDGEAKERVAQLVVDCDGGLHIVNDALLLVAKHGDGEEVKALLPVCNIEATNNEGSTALHLASIWGRVAVVELLLSHGANIEATDGIGATPLMAISVNYPTMLKYRGDMSNQLAVVKVLLSHGASTEATINHIGTALAGAATVGWCPAVELLLSHGANIEAADDMGVNPLLAAAFFGYEATVELLLSRGANIEAKCRMGILFT